MKRKWLWCCLVILLLFPAVVTADVAYEGKSYPEDAEYIDLGDLVVRQEGKPLLVPEDDKRPEFVPADVEFSMTEDDCEPVEE